MVCVLSRNSWNVQTVKTVPTSASMNSGMKLTQIPTDL
ncbi:hypothetical protein EVA_17108 [gut metagenome]|uniref:Uncharacterized protein n=1 Tax=gut metagenome TaxID=749906 RepID=J9C4N9_9ZZZZ